MSKMKKHGYFLLVIFLLIQGCSGKLVRFSDVDFRTVNREIIGIDQHTNSLALNNQKGAGLAIIEGLTFDSGIIEVELKGEDLAGKSFVGVAFNVQNDSTYEAVYFRPFNFQSDEEERRKHSIQYIFHPDYPWKYLRTTFEGQFEADFPRRPAPNDWFSVRIQINPTHVTVSDGQTGAKLLTVERLTSQRSDQIALWTGHDSRGEFRNLITLRKH